MTCEELSLEYGAYALGVAEEPERSEIAGHLARACPLCTPGVSKALALVGGISGAVKTSEPSTKLRRRIVAMVDPEPKRSWLPVFVPWALAGALAILLAVAAQQRLTPPPELAKLNEVLGVLNDPSAKDVSFGEPAARGRVFVSPGKGIVLIASHMPALTARQTFELWVIPADGKPIPSGLFRGADDSSAVFFRPGAVSNAAAVAVSVEPEGGSPQPTSTPIIVTKLL